MFYYQVTDEMKNTPNDWCALDLKYNVLGRNKDLAPLFEQFPNALYVREWNRPIAKP